MKCGKSRCSRQEAPPICYMKHFRARSLFQVFVSVLYMGGGCDVE